MSDTLHAWLPEFQTFRGLATIEIVMRHVTILGVGSLLLIPSLSGEVAAVIYASTYLALAQFLFISGVVLFNKYRRDYSLSTFYKKRVNAVLWPYLIFSTFYFFYPYVYARLVQLLSSHSVASLDGSKLTQTFLLQLSSGLAAGHLWFILLILQLYALYPLIVRGYNRIARQRNATVIVLLVLLAVQMLYTALYVLQPSQSYPFSYQRVFFVSWIFYFVLGMAVCDRYDAIKQKVQKAPLLPLLVVVALFTVGYSVTFYQSFLIRHAPPAYVWAYELLAPAYSVLLIVFYLKISLIWAEPRNVVTRSVAKIGEDSFGIYLVHIYFITVFSALLVSGGLKTTNPVFYLVLFIAALSASYATVQAINRLPFSDIIIGRPRKRPPAKSTERTSSPSHPSTDTHGHGGNVHGE